LHPHQNPYRNQALPPIPKQQPTLRHSFTGQRTPSEMQNANTIVARADQKAISEAAALKQLVRSASKDAEGKGKGVDFKFDKGLQRSKTVPAKREKWGENDDIQVVRTGRKDSQATLFVILVLLAIIATYTYFLCRRKDYKKASMFCGGFVALWLLVWRGTGFSFRLKLQEYENEASLLDDEEPQHRMWEEKEQTDEYDFTINHDFENRLHRPDRDTLLPFPDWDDSDTPGPYESGSSNRQDSYSSLPTDGFEYEPEVMDDWRSTLQRLRTQRKRNDDLISMFSIASKFQEINDIDRIMMED